MTRTTRPATLVSLAASAASLFGALAAGAACPDPTPTTAELIAIHGAMDDLAIYFNNDFSDDTWSGSYVRDFQVGRLDGNLLDDILEVKGLFDDFRIRYDSPTVFIILFCQPDAYAIGDLDGDGLDDVVADLPAACIQAGEAAGLNKFLTSTNDWEPFHNLHVQSITAADLNGNAQDEFVFDFPGFGLWVYYDNATWKRLHPFSAELVHAADIDGTGLDDVVIDFGPQYGIWVRYNDATWGRLHTLTAKSISSGQLDDNCRDDLVIDFGDGLGIWSRDNDLQWRKLHDLSAGPIAVGDLDGSGRDDVVIDFGAGLGVWAYYDTATWAKLFDMETKQLVVADRD